MLLERLSLENYGSYAAKSEFDLSSTPDKPIVLVGGLNGAGKTTLFESLMVALYGKTYLGRRATKKEYMEFISEKMHRHGNVRADSASVEIAFRFYHNGCEDGYVVNRSWTRDGASVSESLLIQKNGTPMNDLDESQWQSFIEGLLPLGIAQLFFFDGEKIVRMTQWNDPGNDEIQISLDMLLGSELINRLYSDLDLYMVRRLGKADANGAMQEKYNEMSKEKESLASDIEILNAECEQKNIEIQEANSMVASKESKIMGIGGTLVDTRENLLTQKAVLEEKLRHQGKTIQEELGEDAPLYLATEMLQDIKKQVESDMSITSQKASAHAAKHKIGKLKDEMVKDEFWPNGVDGALSDKIMQRLDSMFEAPRDDTFFDMAPNDAAWMLDKISKLPEKYDSLYQQIIEYGKTDTHFEKVESDLVQIPKDDEIGPKISEINSLHQEIGILKSEIAHIEQQVSSKQAYQKILQNKLKKILDGIYKNKTADAGMNLASNMQSVLDTYSKNLRERKIRDLESNLLNATKSLLHKKHIDRIEIDRTTFEIRAYAKDDESPLKLPSMGERQMVGTALLWAIAKTSGRSLPFVIDTPLGRLDGKHLSNLMSKFYPFASHQLILLSTDREIGGKEYAELEPYTSRSYQIACDESKSVTTVTRGYFGE